MLSVPIRKPPRSRLFMCLLVLTGLLLAGATAFPAAAQQPDSVAADTTAHEDTTRAVASAERKSPARAVLYSAGGSFLLTPIFGPAMGHFYADDNAQAWRGIALRSGGFLLAGVFGFAFLAQQESGEPTLAKLTINAVAIHAVYDIITAWDSATDYNEAHGLSAQVTPTIGPRGEQVGLALRVSF